MSNYKTPGVYVEEISVFPPSVAQVATAIPAFVGYTEKAPKPLEPKRIVSLKEYEQYFGKAQPESIAAEVGVDDAGLKTISVAASIVPKYNLYYQMQMYFANGGGPCYIVSVGTAYPNSMNKANIKTAVDAIAGVDEPTLIVIADATDVAALNEINAHALAQAGKLMDRFVIMDVDEVAPFTSFKDAMGTKSLSYGAAYYPKIKTSLLPYYADDSVTLTFNGLTSDFDGRTLADVLAGYDPDPNTADDEIEGDEALYRELKGKLDIALESQALTLYPSGAVAGIYATVDANRGVWKAPANVSLSLVKGTSVNITDEAQGDMNIDATTGKSINAIRTFFGKGTLIWGARTLAGNDNEWRYISVRRFYNMVEESVKKATSAFVFEPNNANTWVKVRAMIENFLTLQWRAGALAGAKPEDAFFVRVGLGQTMDANDILEGRMIVEIGMAAVRPAEFIILRFSHKMQQS
jgi:phage tail sheath protein FI